MKINQKRGKETGGSDDSQISGIACYDARRQVHCMCIKFGGRSAKGAGEKHEFNLECAKHSARTVIY